MNTLENAWLAGLWDGEGSIGIIRSRKTLILQIQMSMTCKMTMEKVVRILTENGVNVRGPYSYAERNPKHKTAEVIRVTGMAHVRTMAEMLSPYAVTKRDLWIAALEWVERRTTAAGGLDENGRLKRGGTARRGYDSGDIAVAKRIRALNDSRRDTRRNHDLDDLIVGSGEGEST